MALKTYGVEGLTDWQCVMRVGKAKASVYFHGGMMTRYGVTPAEYTTADVVKQAIIENSDYFKKGRIKILRESETASHNRTLHRHRPVAGLNTKGEGEQEATEDNEDIKEVKEVEVSCLTDAQNYLKDNFGIASRKVSNRDKASMIGMQYGIKFIGL